MRRLVKDFLRRWWGWLLAYGLVAVVHIWSPLRYPAPFCDEGWLTARAWAFIQTGRQFGVLDGGIVEKFDGYWTLNQWLVTALHSLVLRLVGSPDFIALRVFSLLLGVGLLAVNFWIASRLGGYALARLSTLLLAVSIPFFYSAHLVRYDILATLLGFGGIALYYYRRRWPYLIGFLSGLCIGLAVETHMNSVIYIPAILLLYWMDNRWSTLRRAHFWGFASGGLVGLAIFAWLHVVQYPQTFFEANLFLFGNTQQPLLLGLNSPMLWQRSFTETGPYLLVVASSLLILVLAAIPGLARERSRGSWHLLGLNGALLVAAFFVMPYKPARYAIYLTPVMMMMAAWFLLRFVRQPWRGGWRDYASRVIVWGACAGALALSAAQLQVNRYQDFQQTIGRIEAVVRPGERLIGSQTHWLGLYDHPYASWEVLFLYPRVYGGTIGDAFAHYQGDILILDRQTVVLDVVDPALPWYYYHIPRTELLAYLDRHAELLTEFESDSYGYVQVYRIRWQE